MAIERRTEIEPDAPIVQHPLRRLEEAVSEAVNTLTSQDYPVPLVKAPGHIKADYGIQLTGIAKKEGWSNPVDLAEQVAQILEGADVPYIDLLEVKGPYLNLCLEMSQFGQAVTGRVLERGSDYGKENLGRGAVVVVDLSSPNIAKRMSYGHLRSTVIGDALANLHRAEGYEVIKDNHLGDWGTQFGKLIVAIKRWGNEEEIIGSQDPIGELQKLYIRFHNESGQEEEKIRREYKDKIASEGLKSMPELAKAVEEATQEIMARKKITRDNVIEETVLEDGLDKIVETQLDRDAREWFRRLEEGDLEAKRLWQLAVDLSIEEFEEMYRILGVEFDVVYGESFYQDMLSQTIEKVKESGAGRTDQGALIVDMRSKKLGISVIQKSDGASLYMTRDLACALYRQKVMGAQKLVYVVGADQKLYFQQLFEILQRMGQPIGENSVHVYFGMVSLPEGKMSTREGRVVLLRDVVKEGLARAEVILEKVNPRVFADSNLRQKTVRAIAIGALKWNDLAEDPRRNIVFNWDKALNFEGYSAPYVQYSAVRAKSILQKAAEIVSPSQIREIKYVFSKNGSEGEKALVIKLSEYPRAIKEATEANDPSKVARYVYELARIFNGFYVSTPVLKAESTETMKSRLKLVASASQVFINALGILGIDVPSAM